MCVCLFSDAVWLKFPDHDLTNGHLGCYEYADYDGDNIRDVCFPRCLADDKCVSIVDVFTDPSRLRCCKKSLTRWEHVPSEADGLHYHEAYSGSDGTV